MRRAARAVLIAVELSAARRPAIALVAVCVTLVFIAPADTTSWVWFFQDAGMFLSMLSFAIAGSMFAISGYFTGMKALGGAPELARSPRSPVRVLGLRACGDLAWLLAALLLVHACAYARTALATGTLSWAGASLTVLGLTSATACYGIGLMLGTWIRRTAGLVVVALIPYSLTFLASEMATRPGITYAQHIIGPFIDQSWGPIWGAAHPAVLLLALYCALLATTLMGLAAVGTRTAAGRTPWWHPAVPLVATAVIATVLVTNVGSIDYAVARSEGFRCDEAGHVCAWDRGGAGGVQTWATAYDRTQRALGDLDQPHLTFEEAGNPAGEPSNPDRIVLSPSPGRLDVPTVTAMMLTEYAVRLADGACTDPYAAAETYEQLLHILTRPDPDLTTSATAQQLLDTCA